MTTLTEVASRLENLAEWRRELADDHPTDARYSAAAATLQRIVAELPALEDAAAHRKVIAAWQRVARSPLLAKAEEDLGTAIGFTYSPDTAADFLRALVDRLEKSAALAS